MVMEASRGGARRTAVIGGGALGLTVALRLLQAGREVVVLEREPLPGGLAAGFRVGDGPDAPWLEKFYHHIFRTDRSIVRLIGELGMADDLDWHRPRTVSLRDGALHQLDSPLTLLRFGPLPVLDRLRMGIGLARLKAMANPERLERETAAAWIRRAMGERAYGTVWGPLLRGKFGDHADSIAMPWFWARVHDRTPELGYLRGGFQRFYDRLAERIRRLGGETRFGVEVQAIHAPAAGLTVTTGAGDEAFGTVVSTLPTRLTGQLAGLPQEWMDRFASGSALGARCLILALDRPLTEAYWINVTDPGYPFMVVVEHTNMRHPAEYGGRHLVYLGTYRAMDDPVLRLSHEEALAEFVPHLDRIVPGFDAAWITGSWSFTAPFAQPIVTVGYRARIPPFETPVDGLYAASMFQVYPHDRGQNYSIELAERLVASLPG